MEVEFVQKTVNESKEASELADFAKTVAIKTTEEVTKDEDGDGKGFEVQDIADILVASFPKGMKAAEGINKLGNEAKKEPGAFMRAWTNAGADVLDYFVKRANAAEAAEAKEAPAVAEGKSEGEASA